MFRRRHGEVDKLAKEVLCSMMASNAMSQIFANSNHAAIRVDQAALRGVARSAILVASTYISESRTVFAAASKPSRASRVASSALLWSLFQYRRLRARIGR